MSTVAEPTGSVRAARESPRGKGPTASSSSRRLSFSTGSRIWSRDRASIGTGITGCLHRITGCRKPSRRWRSGMEASGAIPRRAGMRATTMPREAAVTRLTRPQSPARMTGANSCRCVMSAPSFNLRPTICRQSTSTASDRRQPRGVEAPGTADWEAVCADARKTPPQGGRGDSRNRLRTPGPAPPETHESLISRKTVAVVPLTGYHLCGKFFSCRSASIEARSRQLPLHEGEEPPWHARPF